MLHFCCIVLMVYVLALSCIIDSDSIPGNRGAQVEMSEQGDRADFNSCIMHAFLHVQLVHS